MNHTYIRQALAANLASLTVFLAGCWISWASIALKKLGDTEPDLEYIGFRLSKYQISWMTCLLDLGNASSPILACFMMNTLGRKASLLIASLIYCVPTLFLAYQDVWVLYVARFAVGFAKGIAFTVLPLYVSEIADTRIRGTLIALHSPHMYVGLISVLSVGPFISLRLLTILLCIVPVIVIPFFVFVPESPYFLASIEKYEESKESLKWFRNSANVDEEFETIVRKAKDDMVSGRGFKHLLVSDSTRRALLIVLAISALQRLGGITSLIVFGPKTFPPTSLSFVGPAQSSFILLLSLMLGALTQIRLSDTLGRKRLLEFSSLLDCIMLVLMGVYFIFPDVKYSYLVYVCLIGFGYCHNGVSCVPFILVGELFPMSTRSEASSISATSMAVGSFFTNKFHLLIVSFTNTCVVLWIYAFFNFLMFLFAFRYVFETKRKTLEEIQTLLEGYN